MGDVNILEKAHDKHKIKAYKKSFALEVGAVSGKAVTWVLKLISSLI